MFDTPILFLVFNRLDTTRQVFEQIRKIQPRYLYIAADGPRKNVSEDFAKCLSVKQFLYDAIDWDCEVKTLYRDENLGCGKAVSQAITWFFEQEEMGIILEDDCLPDITFFPYCQSLLQHYISDESIKSIGGCNFQNGKKRGDGSYYFSQYPHCWGWATWRRSWQNNSFDLTRWNREQVVAKIIQIFSNEERNYWIGVYDHVRQGVDDIWDYQWTISIWMYDGIVITPNKNLVLNIGYGKDATHTNENMQFYFRQKLEQMPLLKHPSFVRVDISADRFSFRNHFNIPMLMANRIRNLMYLILPEVIFLKWRIVKSKIVKTIY